MDKNSLLCLFKDTRSFTLRLCDPLPAEVFRSQPIADVSPPWWNLGHTSWFFARNILYYYEKYTSLDQKYDYLLNSYYETFGKRIAREDRGKVTSPSTKEMYEYRLSVDERLVEVIEQISEEEYEKVQSLVYIGIQHEQQHQELLVTEIKNILSFNPLELRLNYSRNVPEVGTIPSLQFVDYKEGLFEFGNVEGGWCWDNELSVHKYYLNDFKIANRLVTNGEYLEFIEDGGYQNALLWLADGWHVKKHMGWQAPLYWEKIEDTYYEWSLYGLTELRLDLPVCHVSFYEADAFAVWKGKKENNHFRLATEREWEHVARSSNIVKKTSDFLDGLLFHPNTTSSLEPVTQMYGVLWEWTSNHYEPYPGFRTLQGALAEYNGKFMNNVRVLRGGSCATPENHIRISYRNFWEAGTRFQFTGIRLVQEN